MANIFISYATVDYELIQVEVVGMLKALGFEVWIAPADIRSSENWEESIRVGLESADWFLVVVSAHSIASTWVKMEVASALKLLPDRIIPLVIDQSDVKDLDNKLSTLQALDFGTDRPQAMQKLVKLLVDSEYRGLRRDIGGP